MLRNTGRKIGVTPDNDGADDSEEWITSYADTVTLLLCFFIIFFAEYKKQAEEVVLMQLSKNFRQLQNITLDDQEAQRSKAAMLSKIETDVRSELAKFKDEEVTLGILRSRKEVLLRLYENDFFHIGSYKLKPNGLAVLNKVSALLVPFQDKVLIKVEGHSDSLPVGPFSPYKTNLNLSSLRASQAANILIANNIKESSIRVVGFGSAQQLVVDRAPSSEGEPNGTYLPDKGLKNRRIEIRIQVADFAADKEVELVF